MNKGEILKEKRITIGYTQKSLAHKIGISNKHLSDIECSRKPLSQKLLNKFKLIFNFNDNELKILEKPEREYDTFELDLEIKRKKELLLQIETEIKFKRLEFEKLERTSGIRSKITWGSIEIQKIVGSKIIEIINLYSLANRANQQECIPALKQLVIYLDTFSQKIKKMILEREGIDLWVVH